MKKEEFIKEIKRQKELADYYSNRVDKLEDDKKDLQEEVNFLRGKLRDPLDEIFTTKK